MSEEAIDFFLEQVSNIKTAPVKRSVLDIALFCWGVFDGATVKLQVSPSPLLENPDDMIWFDHPDGTFTQAGLAVTKFWNNADLSEVYIRGILEDATLNTNLNFVSRPRVEMAI